MTKHHPPTLKDQASWSAKSIAFSLRRRLKKLRTSLRPLPPSRSHFWASSIQSDRSFFICLIELQVNNYIIIWVGLYQYFERIYKFYRDINLYFLKPNKVKWGEVDYFHRCLLGSCGKWDFKHLIKYLNLIKKIILNTLDFFLYYLKMLEIGNLLYESLIWWYDYHEHKYYNSN